MVIANDYYSFLKTPNTAKLKEAKTSAAIILECNYTNYVNVI